MNYRNGSFWLNQTFIKTQTFCFMTLCSCSSVRGRSHSSLHSRGVSDRHLTSAGRRRKSVSHRSRTSPLLFWGFTEKSKKYSLNHYLYLETQNYSEPEEFHCFSCFSYTLLNTEGESTKLTCEVKRGEERWSRSKSSVRRLEHVTRTSGL